MLADKTAATSVNYQRIGDNELLALSKGFAPWSVQPLVIHAGVFPMRGLSAVIIALVIAPVGARGADVALKSPSVATTVYDWSGFYIGGQVGGGWASSTTTSLGATVPGTSFPSGSIHNPATPSGILGGVYGGFNYQIKQFLVGIDAEGSLANLTGSESTVSPVPGNGGVATKSDTLNWMVTTTGRIGYVSDNWLLFGKGGWAWAGFNETSTLVLPPPVYLSNTGTSSETRNGWILGAGLEWGFAAHWSAKLEYDYVKFSTSYYNITSIRSDASTDLTPFSATSHMNIVQAGVAYKF
jgi:outer membrane immunogenic protein